MKTRIVKWLKTLLLKIEEENKRQVCDEDIDEMIKRIEQEL